MRLLRFDEQGELKLTKDLIDDVPPYAILSHTWGTDDDEITFEELKIGLDKSKAGYDKIQFCGEQARKDGLEHFWVDTCCIDKSNHVELSEAITSMFRWYRNADKCYVYLSDVFAGQDDSEQSLYTWESAFRRSRWFTRGWTLQELLAPTSVEFFSQERNFLGSKKSLEGLVQEITQIPISALQEARLSSFSVEERLRWATRRKTKRVEDRAYCLLGIFDIYMPLIYGEGDNAFKRLKEEIKRSDKTYNFVVDERTRPTVLGSGQSPYGLDTAVNAAFDAAEKEHDPQCLPNTRVQLLHDITDWIDGDSREHVNWLRGWAGTGKSTIARTIAQRYKESHPQRQLATFFFARGGGDAGHIRKFVGGIATQLASQWPAFERALQVAISEDKEIVRKRQQDQWRALILRPLSQVLDGPDSSQVLLVVDAVDECGSDVDMEQVIRLLLDVRPLRSFRIFVTSRPELSIGDAFSRHPGHVPVVLHNIENSIVEGDIMVFFQHHFSQLRRQRQLREDWPGIITVHQLVKMSATLFIWAATAWRYIQNGGPRFKQRLSIVLEGSGGAGGPDQALDRIYLTVLQNAMGGTFTETEKEDAYRDLKDVLGTISNLYSSLSLSALSTLLGIEKEEIKQRLLDLQSLVEVSEYEERPIRLHHPSFRDFLHNSGRCTIPSLWVDAVETHRAMAYCCITVMQGLEKDVCHVRHSGTLLTEVQHATIADRISGALSYACQYWVDHAEQGRLTVIDGGVVHDFLQAKFLFWLEAMAWMGQYYEAVRMILKLERLVPVSHVRSRHLVLNVPNRDGQLHVLSLANFVQDAKSFMLTFSESIRLAPLQIYEAALHFSRPSSLMRQMFWHLRTRYLKVHTQLAEGRGACQHILEGHLQAVASVAFSPNGFQVVSGSRDNTVRVWDVQTGECQHRLEGHSDDVLSVMFSPDGSQVVSGSCDNTVRVWDYYTGGCRHILNGHSKQIWEVGFSLSGSQVVSGSVDKTVRVWNVQTGECQHTLEGHSKRVTYVVFSPDGSRVASCSDDTTVRVWEVQSGECQCTLEGHSNIVNSVVFSPDGSRVASCSRDKTVRVWDVQSGECQHVLEGHSDLVDSVVFSPDGSRVASCSNDGTARIWDVRNGECQHTLRGHFSFVNSVVFSRDGSRLASCSDDKTVRVWDVQSGECQHRLEGHSSYIQKVVFSPDGSRVASCSYDKTVRVWDVQMRECQQGLKGHSRVVNSVVFSPDGSRVASCSDDTTVRIWDVQSGECQYTLKGHSRGVNIVVFSPDGSRVASCSWDNTVRVWDVQSGECQCTLKGHSDSVNSVVFSPDGSRVASCSWDKTVRVWDVQSGECPCTLKGHSNSVNSVVFSPDGSRVASCSRDKTVRVWDVQSGECQHVLKGHSDLVDSMVFSTDGSRMASCSEDKTVRLWDVLQGTTLLLQETKTQYPSAIFSDNGETINIDGESVQLQSPLSLPDSHQDTSKLSTPTPVVELILQDDWVTASGERILHLPFDYRPGVWTGHTGNVAIGSGSGRITLVRCEDIA